MRMRTFVVAFVALILVASASAVVAIELRWKRTFAAPYPPVVASPDPAAIERGRYLVYGPATCAHCHVPKSEWTKLDAGAMPLLSGNHIFRLPFGEFYSANLTSDPTAGLGRRSDGEIARVLRYGVRADGRAAFPLMEYHDLRDEDVADVISFLRSQAAAPTAVPEHRLSLLGKALMAFAIEPSGPATAPDVPSPRGATAARGDYLANSVSLCASCHTDRDRRSGQLVGPRFGGGQRMDMAADATKVFVPPNLTPDADTSPIGRWSEDQFVARLQQGELVAGTPMPWGAYKRMTDDDMRAVYRYLRTLPPVRHATGPVIQDK
jgi:mono/diheme cytochrome c family protein